MYSAVLVLIVRKDETAVLYITTYFARMIDSMKRTQNMMRASRTKLLEL
jgi:hypothetical protein